MFGIEMHHSKKYGGFIDKNGNEINFVSKG